MYLLKFYHFSFVRKLRPKLISKNRFQMWLLSHLKTILFVSGLLLVRWELFWRCWELF
jgi:hypothetical protein